MRTTLAVWAIALAVLAADASFAQQPTQRGPRPDLRAADKNNDGKVSFAEASAADNRMTQQLFQRLDRNNDGFLSPADRPDGAPGPGPRSQGQGPAGPGERGPRSEDARAMLAKLLEADANKDGVLSFEELTLAKPGYPRENFDRLDLNNDGVLSRQDFDLRREREGAPQGPPPVDGEMLRRIQAADTDGDGSVSKQEFKAAFPNIDADRFSMLDRNNDGKINREDRPINREGRPPRPQGRPDAPRR